MCLKTSNCTAASWNGPSNHFHDLNCNLHCTVTPRHRRARWPSSCATRPPAGPQGHRHPLVHLMKQVAPARRPRTGMLRAKLATCCLCHTNARCACYRRTVAPRSAELSRQSRPPSLPRWGLQRLWHEEHLQEEPEPPGWHSTTTADARYEYNRPPSFAASYPLCIYGVSYREGCVRACVCVRG